ncbi:MAG: T9SS type A sorting domain-containing protein [bacterium]|nr:T9SS type A sorting domain-containing protein [bacterium]
MKSINFLIWVTLAMQESIAQPSSFTISNNSATFTISCMTPFINLVATGNYTSPPTYSWVSTSATLTGSNVNIYMPGNYTVIAYCVGYQNASQTLSIFSNTVGPIGAVTPSAVSISCADANVSVTLAAISPTNNILQQVLTPYGGTFATNSPSTVYSPMGPGTYTYMIKDSISGCQSSSLFVITAAPGFPTFSLSGSFNFSLSCTGYTNISVNIGNSTSNPVPGGPVSYTLIGPGTSTFIPTGNLNMNSIFNITIPGTYTFVLRDNITGCTTKIPVTVFGNVDRPTNLSIAGGTKTLSCINPSALLQGSSTTPSITYGWNVPISPGSISGSSVQVSANFTNPTTTLLGNYTLVVTSTTNGCKSYTPFPVYQNIAPPNVSINTGGQYTLTCSSQSILLNNVSTTGISGSSGFPNSGPVNAQYWDSPAPDTLANSATYTANAGGVYTLVARDSNNGCSSTANIMISDQRAFPNVSPPSQNFYLCSGGQVQIYPVLPLPLPAYTYSWSSPAGAVSWGAGTPSLTTTSPGTYTLTVASSAGCSKIVVVSVSNCLGISGNVTKSELCSFYPNPVHSTITIFSEEPALDRKIEIFNAFGEVVRSEIFAEEKLEINLQTEPAGIYIVTVKSGDTSLKSFKVIKQ